MLHSPQDNTVGIESAQEIFIEAMHPKSFVSLDGADHLLMKEEDARYVGSVISGWAMRYIDETEVEETPEGEVWTRVGESGYITEVMAGRHQLIADEPPGVGGYGFWTNTLWLPAFRTWSLHSNDPPHVCGFQKNSFGGGKSEADT